MSIRFVAVSCFVLAAVPACADREPARDPSYVSASATTTGAQNTGTARKTNGATRTGEAAPRRIEHQTGDLRSTDTPMQATSPAPADAAATTPAPATAPITATETTGGVQPDNTKVNERDRQSTLTPVDQGNSKEELAITAAIRRSLVASKLSFNAKNAKVITVGSKVTLRGPVKSEEEKAAIETFAKTTQGVTAVDNQLEVKK